jgi:hypothetical protein
MKELWTVLEFQDMGNTYALKLKNTTHKAMERGMLLRLAMMPSSLAFLICSAAYYY